MHEKYFLDIKKDVFTKDRWIGALERFIQVLRLNIFVADTLGHPIIHPCEGLRSEEYGCRVLTRFLGLDREFGGGNFLEQFSPYGDYLEYRSDLDLHVFAIPLKLYGRVIAYAVVGPVIMSKRLSEQEYLARAKVLGMSLDGFLDELRGVRVLSYVAMSAILDLLATIIKDFIDIGLENRRLKKEKFKKNVLSDDFLDRVASLNKEIHVDELLVSVLDIALQLVHAEHGSIMVAEPETKELTVRVSRGLDEEVAREVRVKFGDGISGLAAKENRAFVISDQGVDERVSAHLKRPQIKESVVLPLSYHNRVFGVMNIHSEKEGSSVAENAGNLYSLSRLISSALAVN